MSANPFFHVRSPQWPILPGEAAELVNEGMYGQACARYLQEQLAQHGYSAPVLACEDWGWWVGLEGFVGLCGIGVYGRQIEATDQLDICLTIHAPARKKWNWRKFQVVDQSPEIEGLRQTLLTILRSDLQVTFLGESTDFPWD